jgi:SOS-response transcriptional repressor LexA
MVTHDEIRAELIRQIDAKRIKQVDVARKLGIAAARVAEIRSGLRRVQPAEMPTLAEMLGLAESPKSAPRQVESTSFIPNWGRVAQGVWIEQTEARDEQDFVPYDRLKGDPPPTDLFAVTPEGTSMNKVFGPNTHLICRRIPFAIGSFKPGNYVIVERTAHDLVELTCKRVEVDGEGVYWLHSESSDPRYQDPWRIGRPDEAHHADDVEIRVIGKVIRAVRNFESVGKD